MGRPVVYFEIVGRDGDALRRFYTELFNWEISTSEQMPHFGSVERADNVDHDGVGIGGNVSEVPDRPSSTWLGATRSQGYAGHVTIYVEVPDVEAALAHAERLGGRRMLGPDDLGGVTIGHFVDPEGHLIGLQARKG